MSGRPRRASQQSKRDVFHQKRQWRRQLRRGRDAGRWNWAVAVRHSHHPAGAAIIYTRAEWEAFIAGAKDGEFDLTRGRSFGRPLVSFG
jgi:hypothetical protein